MKGGERGYGDGERGRLDTYRYTVTTRMIPALRWAALRAILMFHNYEGQSHEAVTTNHYRSEEKGEPKRNRAKAFCLVGRGGWGAGGGGGAVAGNSLPTRIVH